MQQSSKLRTSVSFSLLFSWFLIFIPLLAAQDDSALRFAVIGDYGSNNANEARVAALVAGWNPDFVLTVGDNNYPDGEAETIDDNIGQFYSSFIGSYQGEYGPGSPTNRFWPTLGNHDWNAIRCNSGGCSGPYLDYFTLPGNEFYYDVDYELVHLFALDSDYRTPGGFRRNSTQSNWLQERLAASDACFNVVFFHAAPYSSGFHGSYAPLQWPFAAWGADVVLSGHDHVYERLEVDGIPYFVNGLGGMSVYHFANVGNLPAEATSLARNNDDFGAMLVTVTESGLTSQFFTADGLLVDEHTLDRSCPIAPTATTIPPTTPAATTPSPDATTARLPAVTRLHTPSVPAAANMTTMPQPTAASDVSTQTPTAAAPPPAATDAIQAGIAERILSWLSGAWHRVRNSLIRIWHETVSSQPSS